MTKDDAHGTVLSVADLLSYQDGAIVSKILLKAPKGSVTVFAFDEGEELSEHTAPFDALVHVLEGEAQIRVAGEPHRLHQGQIIVMPANQPHSVKAVKRFKMMLTMIKT